MLKGTDHEFFNLFDRAAANNARAAELLQEMLADFPETQGLAREILVCEQEGDQITHATVRRINQTLVTPIDSKDILRLSSALDDIVDYTEEVADYLGLYRIEAPMAQIVHAVALLRNFSDISAHLLEIHRLENEADRIARAAIASLFADRVDPMVAIRWKDIFERLDLAIDATERVADVLEAIAIKNA
jgi:uncharacterized protein